MTGAPTWNKGAPDFMKSKPLERDLNHLLRHTEMVSQPWYISSVEAYGSRKRAVTKEKCLGELICLSFFYVIDIESAARAIQIDRIHKHVVPARMQKEVAKFVENRKSPRLNRKMFVHFDTVATLRERIRHEPTGHAPR